MGAFDLLPAELFEAILNAVQLDEERPSATLALSRAAPAAPLSLRPLFDTIHLDKQQRIIQLERSLRHTPDNAKFVRCLSLLAWDVDSNVVVNLLSYIQPQHFVLHAGPYFAPESLKDIFSRPRPDLRTLSVRFRPYVKTASYYQFLKGIYSDDMLSLLASWPSTSLHTLSIVQDPLDPASASERKFAQPLVFFSLEPLVTLVSSLALGQSLRSLRIRLPGRLVASLLARSTTSNLLHLEALDLGTTKLHETDVELLLSKFGSLKHLVLDFSSLFSINTEARVALTLLGGNCVTASTRAARELEKALRDVMENAKQANRSGVANDDRVPAPMKLTKAGRRGVAQSNVSLRRNDSEMQVSVTEIPPCLLRIPIKNSKIRILPSLPRLRSLCVPAPLHDVSDDVTLASFRQDFTTGWAAALSALKANRSRLQSWARNPQSGVRVLQRDAEGHLVNISREEVDTAPLEPPVLCFAGNNPTGHVAGCAHSVVDWGEGPWS